MILTNKRILLWARVGVAVGLLTAFIGWIDLKTLGAMFVQLHVGLVVLIVAVRLLQPAISALKWQCILRSDQRDVSFLFLWKTYLVGIFISLFLPTSFGGDVYRVCAVRHAAGTVTGSTASVLFDRLTGLFALVTLSCVGSVCLLEARYTAGLAGIYAMVLVLFVCSTSPGLTDRLTRFRSRSVLFFHGILVAFYQYRRRKELLCVALCLSFLFQLNVVFITFLSTRAFGSDVSFSRLLAIIPLICLTEILPISINGLGVRESAFVFFFTLIGRTPEEGAAVALMDVSLRYLNAGCTGGSLLLLDSFRKRSPAWHGQLVDSTDPS